jgi:DNA-binding GntR family transcriptional regulator
MALVSSTNSARAGFGLHAARTRRRPLAESSNLPLYQQLQRALRDAIDRASWTQRRVARERDLAAEFGVSRITVRKAIDGLVSEGC